MIFFGLEMSPSDKPPIWLHGEITTPPFPRMPVSRLGFYRATPARRRIDPARSRPMPSIGLNCHELRGVDESVTWRIVYRLFSDAVLILEVFEKKTSKTPKSVIDVCKSRLKRYEQDIK